MYARNATKPSEERSSSDSFISAKTFWTLDNQNLIPEALKRADLRVCRTCGDKFPQRLICSAWHGPIEIGMPHDPRKYDSSAPIG